MEHLSEELMEWLDELMDGDCLPSCFYCGGSTMDPDQHHCHECGKINPAVEMGLI